MSHHLGLWILCLPHPNGVHACLKTSWLGVIPPHCKVHLLQSLTDEFHPRQAKQFLQKISLPLYLASLILGRFCWQLQLARPCIHWGACGHSKSGGCCQPYSFPVFPEIWSDSQVWSRTQCLAFLRCPRMTVSSFRVQRRRSRKARDSRPFCRNKCNRHSRTPHQALASGYWTSSAELVSLVFYQSLHWMSFFLESCPIYVPGGGHGQAHLLYLS